MAQASGAGIEAAHAWRQSGLANHGIWAHTDLVRRDGRDEVRGGRGEFGRAWRGNLVSRG